ncbi:MAG: hypothetical protein F2704_04495 [Actinobacteria bacterium]|uniref:Unannotated protein n=1 Tax=freshwater metagenome TaxID=449393 RepID=A0A6J7CHN7_9ZZZZ|nr:hypothetical protein [Actinomycetota bacterium]MSW48029.1 hypothetical protein [Actinomycetota bacterium]MSX24333.1 hypothetical protein [Actinomycetota bacterium]MSY57507.1 hypothetical protein [Actinomycetota bacterium]MTB01010.1 hypothetical protein [Actinomycetota bacterium]
MRPTPYVASLRIYEPLSAFDPADRLRWSQLETNSETIGEEQKLALRRTIFPESPALRPDGAHVLEIEGARYVSPWSTATRCWAALEDFKISLPSSVTGYFLPQAQEEVITSGAEFFDTKVPHILTETWIIPPRWFSLFIPEERVRGRDGNGTFTIMRTTIANAKLRSEMAHQAVHGAFGDGPVEEEIAQLGDWLDAFHPQSFLELDYGGLAGYLENSLISAGEDGLDADTSIEDVLSSIAGLASGDGALAGRGYERLVTRWRRVAALEQAM